MIKRIWFSAAIVACLSSTATAQFNISGAEQQTTGAAGQDFGSATPITPTFGGSVFGSSGGAVFGGGNALGNAGAFGAAQNRLGGFGGGGFGGGGFGGGGFGGGGFGGQNTTQNDGKIRATVKLGFVYPGPPPQVRTRQVNARLARLPLPTRFNGIQVRMDGRNAIVSGAVESSDDVMLIEQLIKLEPGVDSVETSSINVQNPTDGSNAAQATQFGQPAIQSGPRVQRGNQFNTQAPPTPTVIEAVPVPTPLPNR